MPDDAPQLADGVTYRDLLRTGPGTPAGTYLRRFWQPVYLSKDLAPGRARPVRAMGEDLTLFRGKNGTAYAVDQRCAHRGAQLSVGWVGEDSIQCIYHGWRYDGSGRCVEQATEPRPFCDKVKIRSFPVQEYLGLIFVYLGEGAPPAMERLPEYENDYLHLHRIDTWPCNYFAQLENALDKAHTAFLHWHFRHNPPEDVSAEETEYGVVTYTPGMNDAAGHYDRGYFMMPNAHEWATTPRRDEKVGYYARGWRVPVDDRHHIRINLVVVPLRGAEADGFKARLDAAEETARRAGWSFEEKPVGELAHKMLRGEMEFSILKEQPQIFGEHLTDLQDCTAMAGLGDIATREHHEFLGRTDLAIVLLRRTWAREIARLARGEPLKDWRRPPNLFEAIGRRN
jgi:5,5'-dehydrodivanillate O-demethylase